MADSPIPSGNRTSDHRTRELTQLADACVACGMCLPRCPTYRQTGHEAESPRGRIALIKGMAEGRLPVSEGLVEHLDHCLVCQACEKICPAQVHYGRLIDGARAYLEQTGAGRASGARSARLLSWIVHSPARTAAAGRLLSLAQFTGMLGLARRSGLAKRLGYRSAPLKIPPVPLRYGWHEHYPAHMASERGRVALFLGCMANVFDRHTLRSAIELLNRLGYSVVVPRGQGCCGALDLHAGRTEQAATLMEANLASFPLAEVDAAISTASGCTSVLSRYGEHGLVAGRFREGASRLGEKIKDISQFLMELEWPSGVEWKPIPKKVVLHTPCTLANVLGQERAPWGLLQQIPQMELLPLAPDTACCGAAGANIVENEVGADHLGNELLDAIVQHGPDTVATSNVGCALHLRGLARVRRLNIEVVHPVQLLEQAVRL